MITVFGATGYTGKLVCAELLRLGADFAIAGRTAAKLLALRESLGGRPKTIVAQVTDRASLAAMCEQSSVVVSCAGPFLEIGHPVVDAALASGAHYLDTTGEQIFMKNLLRLDGQARQRGKAVVSAVATQFVPTDCLAAVAAAGVERVLTVDTLTFFAFRPSVGTMKSALGMVSIDGFSYIAGEWVEERLGSSLRTFELPGIGRVGGFSYPGGGVITIPRHLAAARVRSYLTFPSLPAWAAWPCASAARALPRLARSPVGGWLKRRLQSRGTEGPTAEERRTDSFCFALDLAGHCGARKVRRIGVIGGSDVYGTTAVIAAHGARLMAGEGYARSGVLAPAQAFDPGAFLEYLRGFGVEWKVVEHEETR